MWFKIKPLARTASREGVSRGGLLLSRVIEVKHHDIPGRREVAIEGANVGSRIDRVNHCDRTSALPLQLVHKGNQAGERSQEVVPIADHSQDGAVPVGFMGLEIIGVILFHIISAGPANGRVTVDRNAVGSRTVHGVDKDLLGELVTDTVCHKDSDRAPPVDEVSSSSFIARPKASALESR